LAQSTNISLSHPARPSDRRAAGPSTARRRAGQHTLAAKRRLHDPVVAAHRARLPRLRALPALDGPALRQHQGRRPDRAGRLPPAGRRRAALRRGREPGADGRKQQRAPRLRQLPRREPAADALCRPRRGDLGAGASGYTDGYGDALTTHGYRGDGRLVRVVRTASCLYLEATLECSRQVPDYQTQTRTETRRAIPHMNSGQQEKTESSTLRTIRSSSESLADPARARFSMGMDECSTSVKRRRSAEACGDFSRMLFSTLRATLRFNERRRLIGRETGAQVHNDDAPSISPDVSNRTPAGGSELGHASPFFQSDGGRGAGYSPRVPCRNGVPGRQLRGHLALRFCRQPFGAGPKTVDCPMAQA